MMRILALLFPLTVLSLHAANLDEARKLIEAQRVPEARPLVEQAVAASPDDPQALLLLGTCQVQMFEFEPAVDTLAKAAQLAPRDSQIQAMLGSSLLMLAGNKSSLTYVRKGRAALDKAMELDPNNITALETGIGFYANAPWLVGGDKDKAKVLIARLQKVDAARGFSVEVGILAKEKKFEEAFKLCEKRLADAPSDYVALYEFGRICGMASKRQAEGVNALEKCLALPPPAGAPGYDGANFRLGVLHKQLAQPELANRCFDEALRLAGNNPDLVKRIARAR